MNTPEHNEIITDPDNGEVLGGFTLSNEELVPPERVAWWEQRLAAVHAVRQDRRS